MGKPTIRFEGYTDDWEQRKLNEIADKVSEKNKNNEFSEPFTNSAEQGIISQKDYFDREIVNNENLNGYYIVRNDDFIYNPRISATAPVGPINRNRLGRNGVMSPLYTVFRTHDIDNLYLEFYFKTTKWHRFMKLNGDSGARFDRFTISSTQFMEMPIPYPTLEEQQKIGEYFESLDTLITLHQRKCEETKKLKKFMLQKMFPKKGEKVPEIRFGGFTDDWEQRKLDDVVEFLDTMRKPLEGAKRISGPYPYYGASGIVDYVDGYLFDEELILLSEDGANITDRNYPVCFLASGKYWVNNHAHVLRTKQGNENNFICNSLERKDYTQYNTGMAMPKLNKETCKKIPILCPGFEEQKKIGDYFRSLDNLITLHQRKCEETKKLKKFMLQKMFPKKGEKVPEIRFGGFTDDWEQRKLDDVVEFLDTMRKPLEGAKRISGPYPYYGASGIVDYVDGYLFDEELILLSEDGANITDRNYPVCFLASGKYWVNNHAHVLRTKQGNENNFICNSLERKDYTQYNTGMAMPKLNKETCKKIPILCPGFEEQKKIGDYFRSLDNLITLHQHKCEELQNIKKFMLQNMFI